jgi:hypothetical protein
MVLLRVCAIRHDTKFANDVRESSAIITASKPTNIFPRGPRQAVSALLCGWIHLKVQDLDGPRLEAKSGHEPGFVVGYVEQL